LSCFLTDPFLFLLLVLVCRLLFCIIMLVLVLSVLTWSILTHFLNSDRHVRQWEQVFTELSVVTLVIFYGVDVTYWALLIWLISLILLYFKLLIFFLANVLEARTVMISLPLSLRFSLVLVILHRFLIQDLKLLC
jgi:hypothetical protein